MNGERVGTHNAMQQSIGSCHSMRNGRVKYLSTTMVTVISFSSAFACNAQLPVSILNFFARKCSIRGCEDSGKRTRAMDQKRPAARVPSSSRCTTHPTFHHAKQGAKQKIVMRLTHNDTHILCPPPPKPTFRHKPPQNRRRDRPDKRTHTIHPDGDAPLNRIPKIPQRTPNHTQRRHAKNTAKEPANENRPQILRRRHPNLETAHGPHPDKERHPAAVQFGERTPDDGPEREAQQEERGAERHYLGAGVELGRGGGDGGAED